MADWWGKKTVAETAAMRVLTLVVDSDLMLELRRAAVLAVKMVQLMAGKSAVGWVMRWAMRMAVAMAVRLAA